MMIDEAIEKFKFIANSDIPCPRYCMLPCDKCVDESKQLAEWLEELKAYRGIGTVEECRNSVLDIVRAYNKAVDDFVEYVWETTSNSDIEWITRDYELYDLLQKNNTTKLLMILLS